MSLPDRKRPHQICRGYPRAPGLDAFHQGFTNAERADAKCVPRNAEAIGHLAAVLDALLPLVAVVLDNQLPLVHGQLFQATLETVEPPLPHRDVFPRFDPAGRPRRRGGLRVEADLPALSSEILEQDESRDHVAIPGWRRRLDEAGLFQRPADPVECLVRQFVGCRPIPPIEVRDQTAAHFDIPFSMRVDSVVQPFEQPAEGAGRTERLLARRLLRRHLNHVLLSK
jgi:hypothetical protein